MPSEEANLAHPDGVDPADLPGDAPPAPGTRNRPGRPRGSRNKVQTTAASLQTRGYADRAAKAPMLLRPEHDPVKMLSGAFDMIVAANSILVKDFGFDEPYAFLINVFRDPQAQTRDRLSALDKLLKMYRDALVNSGALTKTTLTDKLRSPDGTTTERSIVAKRIMSAFTQDNANASSGRKPVRNELPPPPPEGSPAPEALPGSPGA